MKKFKKSLAVVLSACAVLGAAALSACSNNGDDNGGAGGNGGVTITEQQWNEAFEAWDYSNYSETLKSYDGEKLISEFICKVTEDKVYFKEYQVDTPQSYHECYVQKKEDGTFVAYSKGGTSDRFFLVLQEYAERYFYGVSEYLIQVSYSNLFNNFAYDKATDKYSYDGELQAKSELKEGTEAGHIHHDIMTLFCDNNVVTVSDNNVTSIKCHVSKTSIECKCDYDNIQAGYHTGEEVVNGELEYYDIGSTVVEIPQSVIDEATQGVEE